MSRNDKVRPNRLKGIREAGVPLTQKEVATVIGVDYTTISRHEAGKGLTPEHIEAYTRLYKLRGSHEIFMDPESFAGETNSESDSTES